MTLVMVFLDQSNMNCPGGIQIYAIHPIKTHKKTIHTVKEIPPSLQRPSHYTDILVPMV